MARAKSELRPCGIASGPVAASGHPIRWEFVPSPPRQTIGEFMPSSTDSADLWRYADLSIPIRPASSTAVSRPRAEP